MWVFFAGTQVSYATDGLGLKAAIFGMERTKARVVMGQVDARDRVRVAAKIIGLIASGALKACPYVEHLLEAFSEEIKRC